MNPLQSYNLIVLGEEQGTSESEGSAFVNQIPAGTSSMNYAILTNNGLPGLTLNSGYAGPAFLQVNQGDAYLAGATSNINVNNGTLFQNSSAYTNMVFNTLSTQLQALTSYLAALPNQIPITNVKVHLPP